MTENFCDEKILKVQYHCPWKSHLPAVFLFVSVCILCIFWPTFIALNLKTFFWQVFKGTHQVQNLLRKVPEKPSGVDAQEAGGHHQ